MAFLRTAPKAREPFAQDGQTLLHRRILRLEAHHAPGALYQCGADLIFLRKRGQGF
jgi:hypothetical protein